MATSILRFLLKERKSINRIVSKHIDKHNMGPFSEMFPLLFNCSVHDNLLSFLDPVSESFTYTVDKRYQRAASELFSCHFIGETTRSRNVRRFIAYLFMVYAELWGQTDAATRANIFRFMTDFPLSQTRVIICFHTPSGQALSCGYALHGAPAETTYKVLKLLNLEADGVQSFVQNVPVASNAPAHLQNVADLAGWINQGVLLMNIHLTYKHEIWSHFSHCLIKVISSKHRHMAFILAGKGKQLGYSILNPTTHYKIALYHPKHGIEHQKTNNLWENQIPFLNANFYFYQALAGLAVDSRGLIDWHSISVNLPGRGERNATLSRLFEFILKQVSARGSNKAPFIIRRNNAVQGEVLFRLESQSDKDKWQMSRINRFPTMEKDGFTLDVVDFAPSLSA